MGAVVDLRGFLRRRRRYSYAVQVSATIHLAGFVVGAVLSAAVLQGPRRAAPVFLKGYGPRATGRAPVLLVLRYAFYVVRADPPGPLTWLSGGDVTDCCYVLRKCGVADGRCGRFSCRDLNRQAALPRERDGAVRGRRAAGGVPGRRGVPVVTRVAYYATSNVPSASLDRWTRCTTRPCVVADASCAAPRSTCAFCRRAPPSRSTQVPILCGNTKNVAIDATPARFMHLAARASRPRRPKKSQDRPALSSYRHAKKRWQTRPRFVSRP